MRGEGEGGRVMKRSKETKMESERGEKGEGKG